MTTSSLFKKKFFKIFLFSLLSLFLVPLIALLFVHFAEPQIDTAYLAEIERSIDQNGRLQDKDKQDAKSFFRATPPSSTCDSDAPDLAKYRANVCAPYSELWQFHTVRKAAIWTLIGGLLVLVAVLTLGAAAFVNRRAQYFSFVMGWNLLTLASSVEVVVQGALLVWLSFWVTAFFFKVYFLKLILLVGICAAIAVFFTVYRIFKRPPESTSIAGELVSTSDSPALWRHIHSFAARLGTAPPDYIVAGIDTNFFVTEAPLTVGGRTLKGRALFVSLPMLRMLDRSEADAVLAHELAHFRGGDTASSAALGPKLVQYDHYCQKFAAITLMHMYRLIFELALQRENRAREFLADRIAASLVSAQAIVCSLIKIGAYARYRTEIERKLFAHDRQHGNSLGIAQHIASGLAPYAASAQFLDAMKSASIPHPFDSHPAMPERMKNVGYEVEEKEYGRIAASVPAESWVLDIQTAADIERRLWSAYEQRFAAVHEQSLSYRYEPANDAERAIVLKYFPPAIFLLKDGKRVQVTYAGLILPELSEAIPWDTVADMKYENTTFGGEVLKIVHPGLDAAITEVKLPGITKELGRFTAILGHYWQRHKVMRQHVRPKTLAQKGAQVT